GEFGACGRPEPVERRQAEATLERALARNAVKPALAAAGRYPRYRTIRDRLSRRQAGVLGGELARAAAHELEAAGGDVGRGNRPFVAGAPDRREPIGRGGLEQRLLGQCAGGDEADDCALDQRLRSARL